MDRHERNARADGACAQSRRGGVTPLARRPRRHRRPLRKRRRSVAQAD
jgi:hypothetical protein